MRREVQNLGMESCCHLRGESRGWRRRGGEEKSECEMPYAHPDGDAERAVCAQPYPSLGEAHVGAEVQRGPQPRGGDEASVTRS